MPTYVIDVGKILAGIQVPPDESKEFDEFLEQLGYEYVEETNNDTFAQCQVAACPCSPVSLAGEPCDPGIPKTLT